MNFKPFTARSVRTAVRARLRIACALFVLSPTLAKAERVAIPKGWVVQGSKNGDADETPKRAFLRAFAIDRTEVTNREYEVCVGRGHCRKPSQRDPRATPLHPVTWVSWRDASRYCRFVGGRLPSEAEWERSARGDDDREFPWGNEANCAHGNYGSWAGEGPCGRENPGHPVAVGQYPEGASSAGVLDLAGNVWEWVADRYGTRGTLRSVRGGSCCSEMLWPRVSNRTAYPPHYRDADLGFRCAYDRL